MKIIAGCLAVVVALTGCSYTPTSAPVPKSASMPFCSTLGPIAAGADPYVQKERQKSTFGGDLAAAGVIPVQLFLQNNGEKRVMIRPSDMVLVLPDGSRMSPAGASAAAAKMESNAGVVAAAIGFGLVGMLVASNSEDKARAARREDYRRKELQDARLAKGESTSGFVFFIPPADKGRFDSAVLKVRSIDAEDASCSDLELAIKDLKFEPSKPADPDSKTGLSHQ